jgi:anti-sigma B factor antagonist
VLVTTVPGADTCGPAALRIQLPAVPASLAVVRAHLRTWLPTARVNPSAAADVLLAVGEAASNAVEHAVRRTAHNVELEVTARATNTGLALTVKDNRHLANAAVEPSTRVRQQVDASTRRHGDNHANPAGDHGGNAQGAAFMTNSQFGLSAADAEQPPVVTASGDIDLANVNEFQEVLSTAAADSDAITVDLSNVSYCDSAAVRALFAVAATTKLGLIVPTSGTIMTLLSISGLDRVATVTTRD